MSAEIRCPRCGSTQITADKKGFSGGKAVAGAVLAGPIGVLAGTMGSNKVKITCLSCGNTFAPGQGKVAEPLSTMSAVDQQTMLYLKGGKKLQGIAFYQKRTGADFKTAQEHIEKLYRENNLSQAAKSNDSAMLIFVLLFTVVIGFMIWIFC